MSSSTAWSEARVCASLAFTSASSFSASVRATRFGATCMFTWKYLYMAWTHWHMAVHGTLTSRTFAGWNRSSSMYGLMLLISDSGMLSRS